MEEDAFEGDILAGIPSQSLSHRPFALIPTHWTQVVRAKPQCWIFGHDVYKASGVSKSAVPKANEPPGRAPFAASAASIQYRRCGPARSSSLFRDLLAARLACPPPVAEQEEDGSGDEN